MDLHELQQRAIAIQAKYKELNIKDGHKPWGAREYMEGFVEDVGDLIKLIMAKEGIRQEENVDQKIAHELSDCLWSILILAHELEVDLEQVFLGTMEKLSTHIEKRLKKDAQ